MGARTQNAPRLSCLRTYRAPVGSDSALGQFHKLGISDRTNENKLSCKVNAGVGSRRVLVFLEHRPVRKLVSLYRKNTRYQPGPATMVQYQFLCLVIVAALGIGSCHSQSLVQDTRTQDNTPPSMLKEVEDNSRYKTLEANATLLKLLVDDKDGVSRSEVFDMLHSKDESQDRIDLLTFPQDAEEGKVAVPIIPDSQAEFLQAEEPVRKDSQRMQSEAASGEPIGLAAGIMVAVTCSIVALAYTTLIVWRRIYLKKNGLKHELLRNEEAIAETRIEL
ncbi:uncharacterized protein [Maniola hyperantus]|uniref:uncharacterized protein isoform X1 n=1 Tax=Aphantopus hyperantus TaxID=2795564 RepID=UPI001569571F|nr:uncharacterized protein LOC117987339 [Maniola hyperantus]